MDSNNNPSEQTQPSFMPAPPVSVSPVMPEPARKNLGGLWIVILLFVVAIAAAYYFIVYRQNNSDQADLENVVFASEFAPYEEISVNMSPKVPAYKVAADLSNVENIEGFSYGLDQPLKDMLAKNGFAVKPGYDAEFFSLYEKNRYNFTPNFVTTDSLLHNYHLLFDHLLRTLEEDRFFAELKSLNERMLAMSLEQYNEAGARGTDWENAAKRNVGFFAVGSKLLDNSVAIPDIVKAEVEEELMLIDAHSGITLSPVMNMNSQGDILGDIKEDYSQYIPRGHYEKSDKLKAYFRSMMWYGRLTFRLENDDEIKSAILITSGLHKEVNRVSWDKLYEPISFFVGKADDITYKEFGPIYNQVYGKALLSDVIKDKNKFQIFKDEAKKLDPPQINSMPIFNSDIQPDREAEIKGFRFLGQRFTIDAAIFQRLIDRDVPGRMLPRGLDIPAAFGSDEALAILTEMGETKYPNYSENMGKMRTYLKGLSGVVWNQNLYWGWMYTLRSLIGEKRPATLHLC